MRCKVLLLLIILLTSLGLEAQRFVPIPVLPGNTYNVDSKNDTLWIITNKQFKKTLITHDQLKVCKQQKDLLVQQNDTLKELILTQKVLIDTLKHDRDFYVNNWKKAENDLEECTQMVKNQSKYKKIAIIVGSATTVSAFIVGFILGIK